MIDLAQFVPEELKQIAKLFPEKAPLYIVGGFVRDAIEFNKASQDIDVASGLTPPELAYVLKDSQFKLKAASPRLGTMIIKGQNAYEYTAFRTDSYPKGVGDHSPQEVTFTRSLDKDARRRDFKCNAIYYDIVNDKIIDPLGGIQDIQNKVLSTTIEPEIVLSQDGLRIMRLARMVSTLGYAVDEATLNAAKEKVDTLKDISIERISAELLKILLSKYVYDGLSLLREIGAIKYIIPELDACDKFPQNEKFHKYDVLEHTFKCVEYAPRKLRIAALLHDVAKPVCQEKDGNVYKHDIVGAQMAKKILTRMKFPNQIIDHTVELVGAHMFNLGQTAKKATIRRFIVKHADNIQDIIALQRADALATGMVKEEEINQSLSTELQEMKDKNIPMHLTDLKITGQNLYDMGFRGKMLGSVLDEIFDNCVIGCIVNEKEALEKYSQRKLEKANGNSDTNN